MAGPPSASLRRFAQNRSGNIAILAGFTLPVLALAMGIAVDFGNSIKVRAKLQSAADAGILAAAVHLNLEGDDPADVRQAQAHALRVLKENMAKSIDAKAGQKVTMSNFSAKDGVVSFDADISNENYFSGIIGQPQTPVGIGTEALYGGEGQLPVRVALVLDNSGSMSGTKLSNLKSATKDFVDILEEAEDETDEDEVHIGVVPFSSYVNVGTQRRGEPWLSVRAETATTEMTCNQPQRLVSESNCRNEPWNSCVTTDGIRSCSSGTTRVCDQVWEDDGPEQCGLQTHTYSWDGCVTTRRSADYSLPYYHNEQFLGLPELECPGPLQTLTTNFRGVRNMIDGMVARGNTMIAQGVQWGRILLENRAPFAIPDEEDRDLEYLVIMTDGNNTVYRDHRSANEEWAGARVGVAHKIHEHDGEGDDVDDDTVAFCQAARDDDIRVMTIAFEVSPGSDAYRIMSACASEPDLFFSANSSNDLRRAFKAIADRINRERFKVRLSS